jgi:hypothetical protein
MQIFILVYEKNDVNGINRLHFYVYTRPLNRKCKMRSPATKNIEQIYWWCCCCCFDHGTTTTTIITASHSCGSRLDIVASRALHLLVADILAKGHSAAPMTILGTKLMTVPQCQLASPVLQFRPSNSLPPSSSSVLPTRFPRPPVPSFQRDPNNPRPILSWY